MTGPAVDDPEIRRRNLLLGWILGGLCLAIIAIFMTLFTLHGFPKDPAVVRAQAAEAQAAPQVIK